jgi:hypothetical protein
MDTAGFTKFRRDSNYFFGSGDKMSDFASDEIQNGTDAESHLNL